MSLQRAERQRPASAELLRTFQSTRFKFILLPAASSLTTTALNFLLHQKEIISDKVLSEIIVETAIGDVAAIVTTRSVHDMGLGQWTASRPWSKQPAYSYVAKAEESLAQHAGFR
jgi:molybdopterin-binding protein